MIVFPRQLPPDLAQTPSTISRTVRGVIGKVPPGGALEIPVLFPNASSDGWKDPALWQRFRACDYRSECDSGETGGQRARLRSIPAGRFEVCGVSGGSMRLRGRERREQTARDRESIVSPKPRRRRANSPRSFPPTPARSTAALMS